DSDCFGGLEIDYKSQFGGSLYRQIARFCAFQNLPSVDADLIESIRDARSVIHEAARRRKFAPRIHRRRLVTFRKGGKLTNVVAKQRVDADFEGLNSIVYKG